MEKQGKIDFAKLLGFETVSEQLSVAATGWAPKSARSLRNRLLTDCRAKPVPGALPVPR
jgi:hypothetical protein